MCGFPKCHPGLDGTWAPSETLAFALSLPLPLALGEGWLEGGSVGALVVLLGVTPEPLAGWLVPRYKWFVYQFLLLW